MMMDEKEYRLKIKAVYSRVESAFDDVDPDVVEPELGQGTLILLTPKGKIILSTQPSVRQLWLAVAALGLAVHFNYDDANNTWVDDKGDGKELYAYLKSTLSQLVPQLDLSF